VILHNHARGDGLDFPSNVRRSREPFTPSVLTRRSTRIAVHEEVQRSLDIVRIYKLEEVLIHLPGKMPIFYVTFFHMCNM
jgi:hypothetical protein